MLHPWRNPLIVLLGAKASRSKKTVYFLSVFKFFLTAGDALHVTGKGKSIMDGCVLAVDPHSESKAV